jgi:hypothetical protein
MRRRVFFKVISIWLRGRSRRAQQPGRMRRVGALWGLAEDNPELKVRVTESRRGLEQLGWSENVNIHTDERFAAGSATEILPRQRLHKLLIPRSMLTQEFRRISPLSVPRALRDDQEFWPCASCRMRCAIFAPILVVLGTLTAAAQSNSTELVAADPVGQYELIKTIIKAHPDWYFDRPSNKRSKYNLADCGSIPGNLGLTGSTDLATTHLGILATLYYRWVTALPVAGYPRESVELLIQDYERTILQHIVSRGAEGLTFDTLHREGVKLAIKINDLSSRENLKAMRVEYMDECGGPGIEVRFVIDPRSGQVFKLSEFLYKFCGTQGKNPENRQECDHWDEVTEGPMVISGKWRYIAMWPDGTTKRGFWDTDAWKEGRVVRISK